MPEHEIHETQWEPNPHRRGCEDTPQLLEIVPGHYAFTASPFAKNLCNMVGSDPRSQFYKPFPTGHTSEPPWSLGKEKTIKSQKFFASRRQAGTIGDKKETATTSPLAQVSALSPIQDQGRLDSNADSIEGQGRLVTNADRAGARALTHKETDDIQHDNNLSSKNGNPKTNLPARPLPRGLTSKARKRQGRRNRNRRRNRRGRPSDVVSNEL